MEPTHLPPQILAAHLASLRQRGLSPVTVQARHRALERMAARIPVPLLEATPQDLAEWRAGLQVTGNTVRVYASHAHEFFSWAVAEGLLDRNPAAYLLLPRMVRGLPRPIRDAELMAAVESAPPRIRPWLVLAGWAGFRAKEVALLDRRNVLDMTSPPMLIVASDATKGAKERTVPLSGFVLSELYRAGLPKAGFVFRRHDGQAGPNRPWLISHLAAQHFRACGIDASIHMARHRFGTVLYQQTHDLRLVQELMGHADPATTAGYAAYDRTAAVAAVEALPAPARLRAVEDDHG